DRDQGEEARRFKSPSEQDETVKSMEREFEPKRHETRHVGQRESAVESRDRLFHDPIQSHAPIQVPGNLGMIEEEVLLQLRGPSFQSAGDAEKIRRRRQKPA